MIGRWCVIAASVAALAACGDPTSLRASFATVGDTLTVFALTGTPSAVPTALDTYAHQVVRVASGAQFDIVFDLDAQGRAVLYPASLVAGTGRTGLLKVPGAFDDLLIAPEDGYDEGQALTVAVGEVVAVRAQALVCRADLRTDLYSKLVVDGIDMSQRTIQFRMRVDPNCGFRELTEGIPDR
ncbi:MAG: hypothetical protein WKG32_11140 [Gemmatimonadaceae bacterium]